MKPRARGRRGIRRAIVCAAALVATLHRAPALAQESPEEIMRRELIAESGRAAGASEHARAVELATRAGQIRMTPSIQYFLAVEHQALDHPVEALGFAGACARGVEADPTVRNREVLLATCREIVATMTPRVGRVVVQIPGPVPEGIAVRLGTSPVGATLFGFPYPVAPGAHVVEALAPGYAPFRRELVVAAGAVTPVEIALVRLPTSAAAHTAVARAPDRQPSRSPGGPGVGPWIVAGAGLASFALAGVFYALGSSARSERDALCGPMYCDPMAGSHDNRYGGYLTAANAAIGVGAAAVIGGATWWFLTRPRREPRRAGLRFDATARPGFVGADLHVVW